MYRFIKIPPQRRSEKRASDCPTVRCERGRESRRHEEGRNVQREHGASGKKPAKNRRDFFFRQSIMRPANRIAVNIERVRGAEKEKKMKEIITTVRRTTFPSPSGRYASPPWITPNDEVEVLALTVSLLSGSISPADQTCTRQHDNEPNLHLPCRSIIGIRTDRRTDGQTNGRGKQVPISSLTSLLTAFHINKYCPMIDRASLRSRGDITSTDLTRWWVPRRVRIFYLRLTPGNLSSCHNARLTGTAQKVRRVKIRVRI